MKALLLMPLAMVRLLLVSIRLAVVQISLNKSRSLLTTLGIVIGVASVSAVIAALTGLRGNVLSEFESLGTNKIYIAPRWQRNASWRKLRLRPEQFEGLLEHCPSVSQFSRIASGGDQARNGSKTADIELMGIEPAWHAIENRFVTAGRPFSLVDNQSARPVCLITEKLRDNLDLPTECLGKYIEIGQRRFQIVGLLEPPRGSMFGDHGTRQQVLVPFRTLWTENTGTCYAIATSRSPQQSADARAELKFFLRQTRHLEYHQDDDFDLEVIDEFLKKFDQIAMMITAVASGVVGISLLVGGVGIMNIMLVSVSERTREIGLRKAVGARPGEILLQFLVEAVMLSLMGGLLGLLAGHGMAKAMSAIPGIHMEKAAIPPWAVMLSFGFAAGTGVIFGMFPAMKAARLDPIEALRHE